MTSKTEISLEHKWFIHIKNGVKLIEGKKGSEKWIVLKPGDTIKFTCPDEKDNTIDARITHIFKYKTIKSYLIAEGLAHTVPGIKTISKGVAAYLKYWKPSEVKKDGVLAIHFELI